MWFGYLTIVCSGCHEKGAFPWRMWFGNSLSEWQIHLIKTEKCSKSNLIDFNLPDLADGSRRNYITSLSIQNLRGPHCCSGPKPRKRHVGRKKGSRGKGNLSVFQCYGIQLDLLTSLSVSGIANASFFLWVHEFRNLCYWQLWSPDPNYGSFLSVSVSYELLKPVKFHLPFGPYFLCARF